MSIDDELLKSAKVIAAQSNRSLGSVVEEALADLIARHRDTQHSFTIELPVFGHGGLAPGVDLYDKDQIAELLEDDVLS